VFVYFFQHVCIYSKAVRFHYAEGLNRKETRSRLHEHTVHCTISLMFLDVILIVLGLEGSEWISYTIGKGVWFSIRFSSFLLHRNCKRLREFDTIEISRPSYRGDCE
jgi:hypothetical protein